MWERVACNLEARGLSSLRVSKVKGHATIADVHAGVLTDSERVGNEWSDILAERGRGSRARELQAVASWFLCQHAKFDQLCNSILRMMLA
eukprot:14058766-Alexandrium_andersonii.AAC.1